MASSLRARVLTRAAGVTCFIVETAWPGFQVRRMRTRCARPNTPQKFTWRICASTREYPGHCRGVAIANAWLARQRIPYAAECLGVAIKAHEMAVAYAKIRETFGAPLASRQGIQWMLVDNEIDIRTARLLILDAAAKAERGEPFRTESAMAKLVAAEASGRVVDRSMQIHGGLGVAKDLPLERWYREIRIRRIGEGPSEVQKHIIARDILGAGLR